MPNEIDLWLSHLSGLQAIFINLAPGFVEGDLKKFGHQKLSEILPSDNYSDAQIKNVMSSVGAQCQTGGIGIPTSSALEDLTQTPIEFINRISNVSIIPALVRIFRRIGIKFNSSLANFGTNAVAGMTVTEVLGAGGVGGNQYKQEIKDIFVASFSNGQYTLDVNELDGDLASSKQVVDVAKRIVN